MSLRLISECRVVNTNTTTAIPNTEALVRV
jgi:hypothetical protein